jgi:peptidoglycan hydrolase-like protein with peptidoglycan-binding domain
MRVHCPWCTTRLSAQAAVCHRCGAIKKRRPLSMLKLFFMHPSIAAILALGAFSVPLLDLSIVKAAGIFAVIWLILSLIHIALRQRRFWVQLEPLLLKEDEGEEQIEHKSPLGVSPAWAMAATVLVGAGVVWATAPHSVIEHAPQATLPVAQVAPSPPAAPVEVPVVAPARAALPPTPPAQPWKPETTSPAVAAEAPKAEPPATPDRAVVLTAQRLLSDLGYDVGGIDGRVGSRTRAAIKSFRERTGVGSEEINAGLVIALEAAALSGQTSPAATTRVEPRPPRATETTALSNADTRTAESATPAPRRATEPMRQPDTAPSTASLNREQAERTAPPVPRPTPPAAQVPVNGTMMPMVPMVPRGDNAPPRVATPPHQSAQQAEAAIIATPKTVPIHTLVPTIPMPVSAPAIVDPSSAATQSREMQAPVRLGPSVRLHH